MAKIKYTYNVETCRYEPVVITGNHFFQHTLRFLGISFLMGFVGLLFYNSNNPLRDEVVLDEENQTLRTEWQLLHTELDQVSQQLAVLEQNDDDNYRMILDLEPLPSSVREAGVGGRAKAYEEISFPLIRNAYEKAEKLKNRLAIESQSFNELNREFDLKEKKWASRPAIQPVSNEDLIYLHMRFGDRKHPIFGIVKPHEGLDFTAPRGAPVFATGDGEVVASYRSGSYGNVVFVDHQFDGFETRYAHMSAFNVKKGDKVKRGQIVGYVGNTGNSKGDHLHYEVLQNGKPINPINFFQRDLSNKEFEKLVEYSQRDLIPLD